MPLFDYRCAAGHTWTERRDREDPSLDASQKSCPECAESGSRVPFYRAVAPAVYYHGRGWSRVEKNYDRNGDPK